MESPFGPQSFSTSKVALRGRHNNFVQAHSDGAVDCSQATLTPDTVCDVVQVKPNTVAFRSRYGKYMSGKSLVFVRVRVAQLSLCLSKLKMFSVIDKRFVNIMLTCFSQLVTKSWII